MSASTCTACRECAPPGAWFCPSCGAPLPEPDPALIDGRYRVGEELGRGAMGIVHRAVDVELYRAVAIKIINPALTRSSTIVAQLRAEARALASVRSDHVAQVYAFGTHGGRAFFAMELVEGRPLVEIIDEHQARGRFVPLSRALTFLEQLAGGLDAVHAAGVVHRDVKPGNVIIEHGSDRPVLVDFGLAHSACSASGEVLPAGSPSYMAPEQIAGERTGPACDVYAFACSAFELLTGTVPYPGETVNEVFRGHLLATPPAPSTWRAELAPVDTIFARALAKNPTQRPRTCAALVTELVHALGQPIRGSFGDAGDVPSARESPDVLIVEPDAAFGRVCARLTGLALFGAAPRVRAARTVAEAVAELGDRAPRVLMIGAGLGRGMEELVRRVRELPGGHASTLVSLAAAGDHPRQSGTRFALHATVIPRTDDLATLLRTIHDALQSAGLEVGAAPSRAQREGSPVSRRQRPTG